MTRLPTRIDPAAVEEGRAARRWYSARNADVAARFSEELDVAIAKIRGSHVKNRGHTVADGPSRIDGDPLGEIRTLVLGTPLPRHSELPGMERNGKRR